MSTAEEARRAEQARKAAEQKAAEERQAEESRNAEQARKAQEARKAEDARRAEAPRKSAEAVRAPRERSAATAESPSGTARTPSDTTPPPGRNLQIAGIATGAGGVLGVAAGIGFAVHARSLSNDLSRKGATYDPSKIDAGHRANQIAIVGMAGGTALVAAGAALYWWGHTLSGSTERVSVAPILSDGLAGLVVAGTWPSP